MMKFTMSSTDEYERLVKFFVENQLEFDGDEEVDTDIIKCWKITQGDDYLVAGCVLAQREGRYIIDGIAVDKPMRKTGIGKILVDKVISEVKERGGDSIYLVARAPGFFKKLGFTVINPTEAPNFFECKQCPQYRVSCHPEVMKLEIRITANFYRPFWILPRKCLYAVLRSAGWRTALRECVLRITVQESTHSSLHLIFRLLWKIRTEKL